MWFLALQPSGDYFFKENKEKGEERVEKTAVLPTPAPSLAFFVIKKWNDETRTAITAHSPPLSPMHEQVTNQQKNEVFQLTKSLQSSLPQNKNTKITEFLFYKKNVCGIKQI